MWLRPFPHAPLLPAAACAVVLRQAGDRGARLALLSRPVRVQRGQRLAYDGMYDTPPVTWYYPATGNTGGAANTLGYTCVRTPLRPPAAARETPSVFPADCSGNARYDTAEMQKPEVVYTPTAYNSAHPSMASSGPARPWWEDAENANTETHYDFAGTMADGKLEARAVPEANFWQNQPGTDGAVRFAWGDDGHRCVSDAPTPFAFRVCSPRLC